jgi:hypothetical protein
MRISGWRSVPPVVIAFGLLAGCARDSDRQATAAGAAPTSPGPLPTPLTVSTRCLGPFRPGAYVPLACFVLVEDGAHPASTATRAFADLRMFGGLERSGIVMCPACGFPPRVFDLDLRVPADMPPGVKTFAVWATDAQGRRADTTASIEVVAR